jgi:hypothetical protein
MRRKVVAVFSYSSGLTAIVIASESYRSRLIGIVIASYTYRSKVTKLFSFQINIPEFPPSGLNLTSHAGLRAQDMEEVTLVSILHIESSKRHLAM